MHGKRFIVCPGRERPRAPWPRGPERHVRGVEAIHTFAGTRSEARGRARCEAMKSAMRGVISARKREPLNTP